MTPWGGRMEGVCQYIATYNEINYEIWKIMIIKCQDMRNFGWFMDLSFELQFVGIVWLVFHLLEITLKAASPTWSVYNIYFSS